MALLITAQWNVTVFHYQEGKVHGSVDHRTVECHCVPLSGG